VIYLKIRWTKFKKKKRERKKIALTKLGDEVYVLNETADLEVFVCKDGTVWYTCR
jgi:hypothetical protein